MDLNATIDIIINDLNNACEIIEDLKRYPGVPGVQVELARSKCRSAADVISLLKESRNNAGKTEKIEQVAAEIHDKEETTAPPSEAIPSVPVTGTSEIIAEEVTEILTVTDEIVSSGNTHQVIGIQEETTLKVTARKTAESSILADQFSNMSPSFNEQLGSMKHEEDIIGKLKTKPLTDLSDAIGVNDRFIFIREIFDGNQDSYAQAISRLNRVSSLSDAKAVIMSFTGDNSDNEVIRQLMDLVKRKLPADE